ncbi:sensor histidine kinase [Streptomyces sp. NPDC020845]|uniref:sensor histidine kinase n=1 Tax=Streptomyces sp. NPDC020845 TaxID=3365096 RepID=UPI003797BD76
MREVSATQPQRGVDVVFVALALVPPLLSQPYTETSRTSWLSLLGFEMVTLVVTVLRRRLPVTAVLTSFTALAVALVVSAAEHAKLTPLAFLPLAVLVYSLGHHCTSWTRTVLALCGGCAITVIGLWANRESADSGEFRGGFDVLAILAPMPLAWAVGFAARTRQALLVAAEQRAADARHEQHLRAAQAAEWERARIAREMHDVVAHSLTLLVVHAETLRAHGDGLPVWAREQADGLAAAGRQAGGELRDLLRVLRDPADVTPLLPVPGFGELDALLDSHRAAGGTLEVTVRAELDSLPGSIQAVGYRIVQESLANARRHAPGAPVRLTLDGFPGQLRVEVVNSRGTRRGLVGTGTGLGLGLVSMRERVDALGGELAAGPTHDGGFSVVAAIPLGATGV